MDPPRTPTRFVGKKYRLFVQSFGLLALNCAEDVVIGLSLGRYASRQCSRPPPHPRNFLDDSTISSSSSSKPSTNKGGVEKKIEFVDFWGTKLTSDGERTQSDPRKVPCSPSLDLLSDPLPLGAYVEEGNPEYDAKATCRVSISVQWGESKRNRAANGQQSQQQPCDANEAVRRLQSCVDAGFNTFQLYDQQSQGLEIAGKMRQETPSYIETHWSVTMKVPAISPSMLESREAVLHLVEQTKADALDSLQLEYNPQSPYTLDTLDHLAELQRDGFVRSIGLRNFPTQEIHNAISIAGFGGIIDFQQQAGNLLLPPRKEFCHPAVNVWMSNPLASGLLTDLYSVMQRGGRTRQGPPPPLLPPSARRILQEWATLRKNFDVDEPPSLCDFGRAWGLYQEEVVRQLQWIALKHQVSVSAVALRWALERGTASLYTEKSKNGSMGDRDPLRVPIVSSAVVDCSFDSEVFEPHENLRQVFRFELDDEDRELLMQCHSRVIDEPSAHPELGDQLGDWEEELSRLAEEKEMNINYPKIDFDNRALWL